MPVIGITSNDIKDLRFTWKSVRMFYTLFCALILCIYSCYVAVWAFDGSLDFPRYGEIEGFITLRKIFRSLSSCLLSVSLLFNVTNLVALLEYIRIAYHWADLMKQWRSMELRVQVLKSNFQVTPRGMTLKRKICIYAFLVLALSLLEHLLSLMTTISFVRECANTSNFTYEIFARQFQPLQPTIDDYILKSILGRFCLTVSTFLWSYSDLFIILLSVSLSRNMKCFNRCLEFHKYKNLSEAEWESNRNYYVMFSELCSSIDQVVCRLTLVSFSNDIFFICVQLLNSLK